MIFASDGIITKVIDSNTDRLVYILTPARGRILVSVKGGKKPGGALTAASQLFTYGNYEIYEKNSMYWMRSGAPAESFYGISSDIERLALGTYLCELANELTDENVDGGEIMKLLLNSLYLISKNSKSHTLIKAVFEIRCAAISGYCPDMCSCAYCKRSESDLFYFDITGGRIYCPDCFAKHDKAVPRVSREFEYTERKSSVALLTPAALAAFRYVLSSQPNKIFSFEIKDKDELENFGKTAQTYILEHLGRGFDSLDFYKTVKSL